MSSSEQAWPRWHIGMAMAASFLAMAHQVAGKASRDAIFLSEFGASNLPAIVAVAAITAAVASLAGSRLLVRLGPQRVAPVSFAFSSVLQVAEWFLLGASPRIAACAVYLHVVAFGALLISSFWSLLNECLEPRSAKALFGKIGGAGTLGGVCGGILAERVAASFGARDVVLLLALLHLVCAVLLWRVARMGPLHTEDSAPETSVVDAVRRYPFLLVLAGFVFMASSGTALLDFVFKTQAAHAITRGAPLLRFFGLYYTGTSLLTFLLQALATRYCVQHAGVAATAGALPPTDSLGGLMGLFVPGFPAISVIRAVEILMRGSLYRSAYEVFYTAVAPGDKRAVKPLIDVGAERGGDAVGSAGVGLMLVLAPGRQSAILALAFLASVVSLFLAVRLRRGYIQALENSLVERAIDVDPSLAHDRMTPSVLMKSVSLRFPAVAGGGPPRADGPVLQAGVDPYLRRAADLRSGDAGRVVRAASDLGAADWALAPLLDDLRAWDEVLPAALDALARMGDKVGGMLVDALLDTEQDFAIRRRVPRVLAYLPSQRAIDGLFEALEDARFEVRFYAGRALSLALRDRPHLSGPPERIWAAVNRELSLQRSVWNSRRLLDDRSAHETDWFFDNELLGHADRNLEHLFTLLSLILPADVVRIAFRALHTGDARLEATALEYLESATPPDTRQLLLPLLEAGAAARSRPSDCSLARDKLLASNVRVNRRLKLPLQIPKGARGRL